MPSDAELTSRSRPLGDSVLGVSVGPGDVAVNNKIVGFR